MPVKGFKTISISQDVYNRLKHIAEKEFRSIPSLIEKLLEEYKNKRARVEVPA